MEVDQVNNNQVASSPPEPAENVEVDETMLRRKVSQILGFALTPDISIELMVSLLKEQNQVQLLAEIEKALEESKKVKSEQDLHNFFRKDLSQMMKVPAGKTLYAVDVESPEMNDVERAYRDRDERFERGEIGIILREEEHKKHVKEGTFPTQPIVF